MSHHISTEGCSKKWPQRKRKKKNEDIHPLDTIISRMLGAPKKKTSRGHASSSFSLRPDEHGVCERPSKVRGRKKKKSISTEDRANKPMSTNADLFPHDVLETPAPEVYPERQLQNFIDNLVKREGYLLSRWERRKEETVASWMGHRRTILQHILELQAPVDIEENIHRCSVCPSGAEAVVRCTDCTGSYMCEKCDDLIHSCNPLHDRQTWKNGFFEDLSQDIPFPLSTVSDFKCCSCNSEEYVCEDFGAYIIITLKGRYDIKKFRTRCYKCRSLCPEHDLANLLLRGYWPGNPDTSRSDYIFDRQVLQLWRHIHLHLPGSSLGGFIGALSAISAANGRNSVINQSVFSKAAAEFGYMCTEVDLLKHQDNMKCPPCSLHQHSSHIDGNHKLYRYKSVSRGFTVPYYQDKFIANNKAVTHHLQQVYEAHPPKGKSTFNDVYCGNSRWKAARETTARNKKLNETGLVVAGCRHALAQKAVNMFAGELYGYSHYLHIFFLMENNVQYIFQDVMCKYWPWAQKVGVTTSLWGKGTTALKPALSVFHAKAHSWHCQYKARECLQLDTVCWGGRYVNGAGAGAGEDMEQAFSHLSRTGNTTKHMNAAGRADTITDHVLFWNGRKIRSMTDLLSKRYKHVMGALGDTEKEMTSLIYTLDNFDGDIDALVTEVTKTAKDVNNCVDGDMDNGRLLRKMFVMQEQVKQAEALNSYISSFNSGTCLVIGSNNLYDLASQQVASKDKQKQELKRIQQEVNASFPNQDIEEMSRESAIKAASTLLQADVELTVNSIRSRQQAIKNIADTSKKRASYNSKMVKEIKHLNKVLLKLAQVNELQSGNTNPEYDVQDILKGIYPWQTKGKPDWSAKKKIVDAFMYKQRLQEEKTILIREMQNFLQFYLMVKERLQDEVHQLEIELEKQVSTLNASQEDIEYVPDQMTSQQEVLNPASENIVREDADDIPIQMASPEGVTDVVIEEFSQRYTTDKNMWSVSPTSLKGLIALKKKGMAEAKMQIEKGVNMFSKVTAQDGFMEMVFDVDDAQEDDQIESDIEEEEELMLDVVIEEDEIEDTEKDGNQDECDVE